MARDEAVFGIGAVCFGMVVEIVWDILARMLPLELRRVDLHLVYFVTTFWTNGTESEIIYPNKLAIVSVLCCFVME